jgi:primosomal replication protein N
LGEKDGGEKVSGGKNHVVLRGTLIELDILRHTPGGVPILKFRIEHESSQTEGGTSRRVNCEVAGVAFDREAKLLSSAQLGSPLTISGFLDRKGRSMHQLVLHATHIEFETEN